MCGVHNYTKDLTVAIKSLLTYHEGASYRRKASQESDVGIEKEPSHGVSSK